MEAPTRSLRSRIGIRAVALFEAAKGAAVLLAGFGVFSLVHRDLQVAADRIVERLHLNPASSTAQIFDLAAQDLTDARLRLLAGLAMVYAVVRFVEAYGLWHARRWAEWFALVSGGVYLPMELYELSRGVTPLKVGAILLNSLVVIYLMRMLKPAKRNPPGSFPQS
jgi:uncharacterized membrane protein (DUF2068 family)